MGGTRDDLNASVFSDSGLSHDRRHRRQLGAAVSTLTAWAEQGVEKLGGARYVPGPKGVGSEEQDYKAAHYRGAE